MNDNQINDEFIISRLRRVEDPELKRSIVDLGMVENIKFDNGLLKLNIKLTIAGCPLKDRINNEIHSVFFRC